MNYWDISYASDRQYQESTAVNSESISVDGGCVDGMGIRTLCSPEPQINYNGTSECRCCQRVQLPSIETLLNNAIPDIYQNNSNSCYQVNSDNSYTSKAPSSSSDVSSCGTKVNSDTEKNVKRYKCTYCDKKFSRPSSLQTHIYSHTGEKPFACHLGCGRAFSVLSNLKRHLRSCQRKTLKPQASVGSTYNAIQNALKQQNGGRDLWFNSQPTYYTRHSF
jgi:hypothetical protein